MARVRVSKRLRIGLALLSLAGAVGTLVWALFLPVVGGVAQVSSSSLLLVLLLLVLLALATAAATMWPRNSRAALPVEVLANGLEPGDLGLVQQLFPQSGEIRLLPISGGYSGAAVFQAQSWDADGGLQRPSVVKIGSATKLQPEIEHYRRYVREYVGNTATLLETVERGARAGLRWAYAGFSGEGVQTLADRYAAHGDLAPVFDQLFAAGSTLGMLLGVARRDPQRALYQEYAWSPRDWQRVVQAVGKLLGGKPWQHTLGEIDPARSNPLPTVARWFGQETTPGERATQTFDVAVSVIHGDLNSRNIMIDGRGAVFVIDFSHTGPGHLLRDFARLETELLLVLDQAGDERAARDRAALGVALLHTPDGRPCQTLRDLFQARAASDHRTRAIGMLRRHAHDHSGLWLNGPAAPYLIALLHTTLDTLRYAQCNVYTGRAALLLASALCHELQRTTQIVHE